MSTLKVDAIRHNSATSDAITTASDGTCTAKLTSIGGGGLSHRNLIINGAMTVAQRATSATADGYQTIDRFSSSQGSTDESHTQSQVDVASGTTPYTLGFRKAFKITNGNQTSGPQNGSEINLLYNVEAQDIVQSGWNYKSSSSFITWSFWIKSSVATNFYGYIRTYDNTAIGYAFETGNLQANTWTKIVKTLPGNANIDINNDNGVGLQLRLLAYIGTAYSDNSTPLHTWTTYNSSARVPEPPTTWYTTNDATLEVTGYQLEVGDTATSFEHRSYQDEFLRCCRYYYKLERRFTAAGRGAGNSAYLASVSTPVPLRAQPALGTGTNSAGESFSIRVYKYDGISDSTATPTVGTGGWAAGNNHITFYQGSHSVVDDRVLNVYMGGGYIDFNSEL